MDKISKLKDSVNKRDRIAFIDIIHDFSDDDIIRLTEQDFEEIVRCCSKIKLAGIEEFLIFLFYEGVRALKNSEKDFMKENTIIGRFYFSIFLNLILKSDINFAGATMNLGIVHLYLGELGIEPEKNLKKSIELQKEAKKMFPKNSMDYGNINVNQGIAHIRLAELGIEPEKNLRESIKLQKEAKNIFPKNSLDYGRATMSKGTAHLDLAELGNGPEKNLEESKKLQQQARKIFPKNIKGYGHATTNLGLTHLRLAELGINPERNLVESIKLQQEARKIYPKNSLDYATATMNQGFAHGCLAEFGNEPEKNLVESIKLQQEARKIYPKNSLDYATATMNQGNDQRCLAALGIEPEKNLENSKKLQQEARKIFPENSSKYAYATMNLGTVHLWLAELGIEPEKNLEESIKLQQEAGKIFPKNVPDYGRATTNQGVAYLRLAELGIEPEKNLEESIKLQQEAGKIFPKNSPDYGRAIINQGSAHAGLAVLEIEPDKNFKIAEELYENSKKIFLETRDGWKYPIAVINNCELYRYLFWKTGDKILLQNARNSLEEAKKNIEQWDVIGKDKILGMLCTVEADIYELEEMYYDAGMKYRDAYKFTKNDYYMFMYEFCGAKSSKDKSSFCKLINQWKKVDKRGIFLDFYDYAVFECILEEAVENEALRFFEITAAKSKLDEIYARTHIHHIKTRVGACIDILNAYLNYFPEKETNRNEGKAIECITNACRAFKIQGNKPEIDLCNMFSKAIKNKDSQDVWIDLIKNHLSNNLSKLIGEAAINEATKLKEDGIKKDLFKIKTGVKEIKINIEELKSGVRTGFAEIDKDIESISMDNEVLRNLLIGYANKTQGLLLKLLDESKNCESKTQELMKDFSEEIVKKLDERDDIWLEKLKNELIKKESEIEKKLSSAPPEIRSKWHQWIDNIKNKMEKEVKEIVRGLPREAVIIVSTEKILEYGVPFLTAAITSPAALPSLITILYVLREAISIENPS
jgi:hypothetical protein